MVVLVKSFGMENAVHPVVEKFSHTGMEEEHPQKTSCVPASHVSETWNPCMRQCHQQKLHHYVVVSAKNHQTTNCVS